MFINKKYRGKRKEKKKRKKGKVCNLFFSNLTYWAKCTIGHSLYYFCKKRFKEKEEKKKKKEFTYSG